MEGTSALLGRADVTIATRAASTFWITGPMQALAVTYGSRPADPTVPLRTSDPTNPFTRLADRVVRLDLPAVAPVPSAEVARTLLQIWSRFVAK